MFSTVSLPYDALQDLPPLEFKLMAALLRYANKAGECWPVLRQLAVDIGKSEATVCRTMQRLAERGCFDIRRRPGNGRYFYRIASKFLPRWPKKSRLASMQDGLAQAAREEANLTKQAKKDARTRARPGPVSAQDASQWRARLAGWVKSGFWPVMAGPKPDEPGCDVPPQLLAEYRKGIQK